ncbi:hypothetical protein J4479_01010 [Candidatus Woesearchaeota archaeon]|nr:hypothetical protein [Candidatus Woesearchaeota archaeon]
MKYVLPLVWATLAACGPKGEYSAPVQPAVERRSEADVMGRQTVMVATEFARQADCEKKGQEVLDCRGEMPLSPLLTVVRAVYQGNNVTLEVVPNYNGRMAEIETPTGEIKPGKIETRQIIVARIDPPEQLYRQIKGKLTLYDYNPETNELEAAKVIDISRCFCPDGKEFPPTIDGKCVLPVKNKEQI